MSNSRETASKILSATLFCAQAREEFTMADVAQAAGLSRQAVYLHYQDRSALLETLLSHLQAEQAPFEGVFAPSARAALASLIAHLAEHYSKIWPVLRALGREWSEAGLYANCLKLAERFREESGLSPHLSPSIAADLLWTILSLAVWKELTIGRGWDNTRYKRHIAFLAGSIITR
jgi:AcrR family transcriptional regulator